MADAFCSTEKGNSFRREPSAGSCQRKIAAIIRTTDSARRQGRRRASSQNVLTGLHRMVPKLILRELWHRPGSGLLSLAAVTAAVAVCVALTMNEQANQRETRRLMRDIGFNLRIIPKDADLDAFYLNGYADTTMPEASVARMAELDAMSYNHLLATLERKIEIDGGDVLLLGLSEEKAPPGRKKPPMQQGIAPETLHVGYQVAQRLGLTKGDRLMIGGREFEVARTMPQMGTLDDIRVMGNLGDVQQILGLPGQINEIKAIDCLCLTPDQDPQARIQEELAETLPEGRVVMLSKIAEARARQRRVSEQHAALIIAIVGGTAAIWVAALAIINVRQRFAEIGVLKALGYGSARVAALILGRAVAIGIVAAGLGFAAGTWAALEYGRPVFEVTSKSFQIDWKLCGWAVLIAPLFAAMASLIPTAMAAVQDPADAFRSE